MDQAITQRLGRLEREMRWWRLAAFLAGGSLGLLALVAAAKPDTSSVPDEIRAKRFVLVDEAGRARAKLDMMGYDHRGRRASELRFLDEEERFDVKLDNRFGLVIADDTGKGRVDLTARGLTLSDKDGKVIWKAP